MERRRVTNYESRGKRFPQIQLRGEWLRKLGYEIGAELEVATISGELRIRPTQGGELGAPYRATGMMREVSDAGKNALVDEYYVRVCLERPAGLPKRRIIIKGPEDVAALCEPLQYRDREIFWSLYLDARNQISGVEEVALGILNAALVHPREIYKGAILSNASGLIMVHNHPSGNVEPSREDLEVTERLRKAGDLLGIKLLDHIIIGYQGYRSLKESGLV